EADKNRLTATVEAKHFELSNYINSIQEDIHLIASNPNSLVALNMFNIGFNEFGSNAMQKLQQEYIIDSPRGIGFKWKYDGVDDGTKYSKAHIEFHPWFRELQQTRGYYDVFLINPNGDVVYSVFKENDFSTNLNTGKWKDTDLANIYKDAIQSINNDNVFFSDFESYGPSMGAAASFIATPILNDGGSIQGILMFQMPISRINHIIQNTDGLGRTGKTYIVSEKYIIDAKAATQNTMKSINLNFGINEGENHESQLRTLKDQAGTELLAAFKPFYVFDKKWFVISTIEYSELNEPINIMAKDMIMAAMSVMIILSLLVLFFAKKLTKPLEDMVQAMSSLASGKTSISIPHKTRLDEMGVMAKALEIFQKTAFEQIKLDQRAEAAELYTKELKKVNDKISRTNEELEQFAYVASHDLKAPLRGIDNLASFIREDLGDNLDEETLKNFDLLQNRIIRMERLLDDLLAYSRSDRGDFKVETVELSALFDDIKDLLCLPEKFKICINGAKGKIDTLTTPLKQILLNVISNGIKHHDRDDGVVTVNIDQNDDGFVKFSITDDGPGIPEEFHTKIFQMFQTLKRRDEVESSGMGLAIAKKIIVSLNGEINVFSKSIERGTRFEILWPKNLTANQN
ncbi:MAG: HAMP domain-containing protein, partial [Emcibacteraceae bacterium]|nr:HAMP domain-containing protein [Emcibacteraceae bacterium]